MGKLIVLEGIDGSGKSTQFGLLCSRLEAEGVAFKRLVFPRYSEPSSVLLRMYLAGEFGTHPEDVNAYAASTFYAVDRYASFKKDWGAAYLAGGLMLADRYTTSNAVHQASKLPEAERPAFFKWLEDFEYGLMGIPAPDVVIYADVPAGVAQAQLRARESASGGSGDIHETDAAYLAACHVCADSAADYYGWRRVACAPDGKMRDIADIHSEIYNIVKEAL